jgi:hypothetical protein
VIFKMDTISSDNKRKPPIQDFPRRIDCNKISLTAKTNTNLLQLQPNPIQAEGPGSAPICWRKTKSGRTTHSSTIKPRVRSTYRELTVSRKDRENLDHSNTERMVRLAGCRETSPVPNILTDHPGYLYATQRIVDG